MTLSRALIRHRSARIALLAALTVALGVLGPIRGDGRAAASDPTAKATPGLMNMKGVNPDATDSKVISVSSLVSRSGAGKAAFTLTVEKTVDEFTPQLSLRAASGEHSPLTTISMYGTNAAGTTYVYFIYTLTDVTVTAVAEDLNSLFPQTERVTLSFATIDWKWRPGPGTPGVHYTWNAAKNCSC